MVEVGIVELVDGAGQTIAASTKFSNLAAKNLPVVEDSADNYFARMLDWS